MSRFCDGTFLRRVALTLALACLALLVAAPEGLAVRSSGGGGTSKGTRGAAKHGGQAAPAGAPAGAQGPIGAAPGKGGAGKEPPLVLPGGEAGTAAKDLGEDGQVDPISGLGIRNPVCDRLDQIRDRATWGVPVPLRRKLDYRTERCKHQDA